MADILIVCTGNTCRSPMAEYLLRALLHKQGVASQFHISSAGLACYPGVPISENALLVLKERGIDASGHVSHPVTLQLITNADRIYVMTEAHRRAIIQAVPETAEKIIVLSVQDPYGMPLERYQECADQIETYFKTELPVLLAMSD